MARRRSPYKLIYFSPGRPGSGPGAKCYLSRFVRSFVARKSSLRGDSGGTPVDTQLDALEASLRAELSPTPELSSRLAGVLTEVVAEATQKAADLHIELRRALVAGSAARETYLPGNFDIDLFVLFPPEVPRNDLVERGLKLGAALLHDPQKKYAEHPYLRGTFQGFPCEVVPGYAVADGSRPVTAVDRTPFHQAYLQARHTPETRGEVRLFKRFLKGIGVYGAEVATEGFSGYLSELLVLQAGSFRGALRAASRWQVPMRLAPPGPEPSFENSAALVLADPVDPHRNVAAAVARHNLSLFILASQEYLASPSRDFFFPPAVREPTEKEAREIRERRSSTVVALRFPVPGLVPDVLYPQLRRTERSLADQLRKTGFHVLGTASAAQGDFAAILIETREARLGKVRVHEGPPVGVGNTHAFLERWDAPTVLVGPYVSEDGRLTVEIEEEDRDLREWIEHLLPGLAMGKDLRPLIAKEATVSNLEDAYGHVPVPEALTYLWRKGLPWLREGSRPAQVE